MQLRGQNPSRVPAFGPRASLSPCHKQLKQTFSIWQGSLIVSRQISCYSQTRSSKQQAQQAIVSLLKECASLERISLANGN